MSSLAFENLGPFAVGEPIGRGGTSEVFEGVHRATGARVALKVTRFRRGDELRRRAFASEIATMARVYHPGIVAIHDWGVLPDRSGNWCAMDLSELGALRLQMVRSWQELRECLLQLLDALAHAHARDIIHRDLKPQNILVFDRQGGREYRLADFGLAYSRVPTDDSRLMGATAGTPTYMAPEQMHGVWREYGPWTDLYALGCVAWEFATGAPPFHGTTPIAIAMAHLTDELPAFVPRLGVPVEFEDWVRQLLGRDWVHRPSSATAARVALEALGEPVGSPVEMTENIADAETLQLDLAELTRTLLDVGHTLERTLERTPTLDSHSRPSVVVDIPLPKDWRTSGGTEAKFGDTGSRLFNLRQTDFVGHEAERDEMWARLRRVLIDREPQVIVLESRQLSERAMLADWFVARVRESAAIPVVRVDLGLRREGLDPFRDALEQLVVSWALDGERLTDHLTRVLPRLLGSPNARLTRDVQTLLSSDPRDNEARLASRGVFWQLLTQMAAHGPVVLSIAAIERDTDAWFMLERLLLESHRVLTVAVTGEEWFVDDSERWVRAHSSTTSLALQPMSREDLGVLVDGYIRLEPRLRETWIDFAVLDIEFAMDSLRHGIAGGALEPTAAGYRMRANVYVSRNPAELTAARLRVISTGGPDLPRIVSLGAALGVSVSYDEWQALLARAGLSLDGGALEQVMRHHFVREERGRYAFESSQIRRILLAHLRPDDREVVMESAGDDAEGIARTVELLLASNQPEEAAEHALGVFELAERDYSTQAYWVPLARRILAALGQDHVRLRYGISYLEQYYRVMDPASTGVEPIVDLLSSAELPSNDGLILELRSLEVIALAYQRRLREAEEHAVALLATIPTDQQRLSAEVRCTQGWLHGVFGRPREARDAYDEALTLAERTCGMGLASQIALYRGVLEAGEQDASAAADWFGRAKTFAARSRDSERLPRVWLESALAFVVVEDYEQALEDATKMWKSGVWSIASQRGAVGWNLALSLAYLGRFDRARDIVARTYAMLREEQLPARALGRTVESCIAALAGDVDTWDAQVAQGPPHAGISVFARLASEAWQRQGDADRAAQARTFLAATGTKA